MVYNDIRVKSVLTLVSYHKLKYRFESGGADMALLNKDKVLSGVGKAVDAANGAADKVETFAREKELDKKAEAVVDKVGQFVKNSDIEHKAEAAVSKTEDFIRDNKIDEKASNVAKTVGSGIKKAGEKIEGTFKR